MGIGISRAREHWVALLCEPNRGNHATMLPPSRLLCNRPDKEEWLLISAAQRLRPSGDTGEVPVRTARRAAVPPSQSPVTPFNDRRAAYTDRRDVSRLETYT